MILEGLSEGTRRELEALTPEEWRTLVGEVSPQKDRTRSALLELLNRVEKKPLFGPEVDVVALVREGRRM